MKKIVFALMAMSLMTVNFVNAQDNETKEESISNEFKRWQVRLRAVGVAPDESAKIGIIGGDVVISNALIPELDFTYFFTEHFAAELILGTAKHDVKAINTAAGDVNLGSVWLLPPTLTAQYHFYTSDQKVFKPYIGAGVNYTLFYNVKSGGVAGIEYDNALGYAAQVGFDLMLDDTFFINLDVKRLFLSTDVTVDASNLAPGLSIPAEVDINPWLIGVGVGMKF
ncbi:outer membrane beta-barrel protein [Flavobacterium sp. LMO8]|uniref:OmpW/AlkL family protein n=1 Tax=Flavobacterium sp. LMO8 TaxID=2654244 RepID=UPI0012928965|nr:OmpW family outer membrane protein [Flavobacterium sp. LMO8]MQP25762.1 outer membrane beta-barrel protein [Flavobacterium sp. LMO8]